MIFLCFSANILSSSLISDQYPVVPSVLVQICRCWHANMRKDGEHG